MKRVFPLFALVCLLAGMAQAQLTTVTASNISDASGHKLASGQACFTGTDTNDVPINYQVGGGGQVIKAPVCASVVNGVITSPNPFKVADTTLTNPVHVCMRIRITDTNKGGAEVLRYPQAGQSPKCGSQPSGTTWSLDTFIPTYTPLALVQTGPIGPTGATGPGIAVTLTGANSDFNVSGGLTVGDTATLFSLIGLDQPSSPGAPTCGGPDCTEMYFKGGRLCSKSVAYGEACTNTASASGFPAAAAPSVSPVSGTYTDPLSVTVSGCPSGASPYYTDNASTVSAYSAPVTYNAGFNSTFTARCSGGGYDPSAVTSKAYVVIVPPFIISHASCENPSSAQVTGCTINLSPGAGKDMIMAEAMFTGRTLTSATLFSGANGTGSNLGTLTIDVNNQGSGGTGKATFAHYHNLPSGVNSVVIANTSGDYIYAIVAETAPLQASPFDLANTTGGTNSSGNIITTNNNDVIFGITRYDNAGGLPIPTPAGGYTLIDGVSNGIITNESWAFYYKKYTATGTYTAGTDVGSFTMGAAYKY